MLDMLSNSYASTEKGRKSSGNIKLNEIPLINEILQQRQQFKA